MKTSERGKKIILRVNHNTKCACLFHLFYWYKHHFSKSSSHNLFSVILSSVSSTLNDPYLHLPPFYQFFGSSHPHSISITFLWLSPWLNLIFWKVSDREKWLFKRGRERKERRERERKEREREREREREERKAYLYFFHSWRWWKAKRLRKESSRSVLGSLDPHY